MTLGRKGSRVFVYVERNLGFEVSARPPARKFKILECSIP